MTNKDKYDQVFIDSFSLEKSALGADLQYQSVESWDSVGHMGMIANLEDCFNISLETDDVIDFSSYEKGKQILSKYGIEI
jgi:hypothetical protein